MSNTQDLSLLGSTLTSDGNGAEFTGNIVLGTSTAGNLEVGSANSLQLQKSGVNGFINQSDSGPLIFRMGSGFTERFRIATDGAIINTPIAGGHSVFNEGGVDADFRVESVGNANRIRVDGGNDRVGIGEALPTKTLSVLGDAIIKNTTDGAYLTLHSTQANNASGPDIVLFRDSTTPADDDALSTIFWQGKNSVGSTKD